MSEPFRPVPAASTPYLEHYSEPGGPPQRIPVEPLPFRIGRSPGANYIIYSRQVSKEHTEIFPTGKEFRIRDLGSTNGTFVNGQRVDEAPLINGDIIHVAHKELRFAYEPPESNERDVLVTEPADSLLPASVIRGSKHLREMLTQHCGRVVFQPIVLLGTRQKIGYEALGRGAHPELSPNPTDLFRLAGQCNLACELSRMFRTVATHEAARLPDGVHLFFNLHPSEMDSEFLVESLRALKTVCRPSHRIVLEIHEGVVADLGTLRGLRDRCRQLDIGLAYDDFGAGQSRLNELAEVPPDFIKLDMSLVRDIDQATGRQDLVQALTRVAADLGVRTIAEGIETREEAEICLGLGCQLGQGYLFGRPQPRVLLDDEPAMVMGEPAAS